MNSIKSRYLLSHSLFDIPKNISIQIQYQTDKTAYLLSQLKKRDNSPFIIFAPVHAQRLYHLLKINGIQPLYIGQPKNVETRAVIILSDSNKPEVSHLKPSVLFHANPPLSIREYLRDIQPYHQFTAQSFIPVETGDFQKMSQRFTSRYPDRKRFLEDKSASSQNNFFINLNKTQKTEYDKIHQKQFEEMKNMIDFLSSSECRIVYLNRYFGQKAENCQQCDYCTGQKSSGLLLDSIELKILAVFFNHRKKIPINKMMEITQGKSLKLIANPAYRSLNGAGRIKIESAIIRLKNKQLIKFEKNGRYIAPASDSGKTGWA